MPLNKDEIRAMTIQVSYDHIGFTATDEQGNTATSTHKEGKEKAIERCKALSSTARVTRNDSRDRSTSDKS